MGTDIHGWVEVNQGYSHWQQVIKLGGSSNFIGRNYPVFAYLFGVRNEYGVEPLFCGRGMPENPAYNTSHEYRSGGDGYHGTSYATWAEIVAKVDFKMQRGILWRDQEIGLTEVFSDDWLTLFKLMEVLAQWSGPENVRLVVWFDS